MGEKKRENTIFYEEVIYTSSNQKWNLTTTSKEHTIKIFFLFIEIYSEKLKEWDLLIIIYLFIVKRSVKE